MYDELVKALREAEKEAKEICANPYRFVPYYGKAADAIEELSKKRESACWGRKCEKIEPYRWIPVTEQLPKYGDWVLGIGPKKGYHVCEYRGITHFPYSGDIPWFSAKGRSLTITHWMPLPPAPEPPKEE